ncbi:MAG TPA: ankyrin repeat domain-containing protein [Burkholderiaceae bacterium]|nr:ankyrin repeat domain-containing protein [Burkholderiaceae bacterium]
MQITSTFLQPLEQTRECPQPYAPEKAVRYEPDKDGHAVGRFERSAKGRQVKAQYRVGIEKLQRFLVDNQDASRNKAALSALDAFRNEIERGVKGRFSTQAGRLFNHGKAAIDTLCVDVSDTTIPLAQRLAVVENLAQGLTVCSEGACSNLIIAADNLRLSTDGPRGQARKVWENMFDQAMLDFCRLKHGHVDGYHVNEIHYVNGYRNYLAPEFGLTERPDSFVPLQEVSPHLQEATRFANEKVTADALIRHLAESCLAEVRDHFRIWLDRPLTEIEAWACCQKYEQSLEEAIHSRYGKIEWSVLVNSDEGKGTEDSPYTVIDQPALLMRAIVRNLKKAGVLRNEKFEAEARDEAAGAKIKRITDDAHYIKEQLPNQKHARYRNVRLPDLLRFSPPAQRSQAMLKNALIATSDPAELRLLDPSLAWDLITNPEGGFPCGPTQWMDALSHPSVKRYRDANPDANEFILLKAQEKIAGNEPLQQEKDIVELMAKGEEMLAARIVSTLTTIELRVDDGNTLLHLAAMRGCDQVLRSLVPRVKNIDELNADKSTALMLAAENGHWAAVQELMKHNADPTLKNRWEANALHYAAFGGNADIVEKIAFAMPNVDETGSGDETALMIAARQGHLSAVRKLFEFEPKPNLDLHDHGGWTAFHLAIANNRLDIVKELLPLVNNLNVPTKSGETPLMLATWHEHVDMVDFLLALGADADFTSDDGKKAFHYAVSAGNRALFDLLLAKTKDTEKPLTSGKTPLMMAAENGHLDIARTLLGLGQSVRDSDNAGWTALHFAASRSQTGVVQFLLDSGADGNALTQDNESPWLIAIIRGHESVARLLSKRGGCGLDLNVLDRDGRTALMSAVTRREWRVVKALVQVGAGIDCRDRDGATPLEVAAALNAPRDVLALLTPSYASRFVGHLRWRLGI